uniref:Mucosa-associated lymphoid tissue lymphoma translocation protein 1 n=1 Tax=Sphenodon punctatus TaxID=8508 RepID=A0A8D0HD87_SPHPU
MAEWNVPIGNLGEAAFGRLCEILDSAGRGWRRLAEIAGAERRFKCSEEELETCSLKVLEPRGSPSQCLLQMLSERDCSLKYLLSCLDKLGHAEAIQFLSSVVQEAIRILVQPESQVLTEGACTSLTCQATGPPGLSYQWFCGKQEMPGATSPNLLIGPVTLQSPAWYICRVSCGPSFAFSQWARLCIWVGSSPASASGYCPTMEGVEILQQPQPCTLAEGDSLVLQCVAVGNPSPQFQWFRNRSPVAGAQTSCLQIRLVTTADRGRYTCKVFNLFQQVWSEEAEVEIGPQLCVAGGAWQEGDAAADKVALLVGNMNYQHHKQLKAPMVDVHDLAHLLRQLDFKVVSLLDLGLVEMQMAVGEFLLLLDKGVYGLLYYAWHGYENFGQSFMVPIDAPGHYTSEHCLCVQTILQSMQQRQTGLNVFLLDMCRKRNPNDETVPRAEALEVTANIVFGYATCADAEAYELSQGELANGIFVSFLKRWLLEDEKITVLLDKVAEDMGTLEITKGRQALELRSNLSERRALTDRIQPGQQAEEQSARNLQWAKAHTLPESCSLRFDCGARVCLGFAAEFSNILVIYTRITATPREITRCEAKLNNFPEELDVDVKFTNKGSPEEVGSSLSEAWSQDLSDCCLYSRLCGLQKLKSELAFTVCLQYQYEGLDDFLQESQEVNIGKPLIAKLNLHTDATPSMDSCPDPFHGCFQSAGSKESFTSDASRGLDAISPHENTPEENLSPELTDPVSM